MKRSLMQVYVRESAAAVELYREAFDAAIGNDWRNPDGRCAHTELDVGGQIIAVSEAPTDITYGSGMQFCLQFGEEESDQVMRAYHVLKEGAKVVCDVGPCEYSTCMFSLFDRFGVYWCVFS